MGNTITTNATLVAAEVLKTLLVEYPVLTKFAHRFNENYRYGNSVKVPLVTGTTAAAVTFPTGYVATDRTVSNSTVTLNKHAAASFSLTPQDLGIVNPAIIAELGRTGANALGRFITDDVLSVVTVANFSGESVAATLDFNTMAAVDKKLADRGVPNAGRFTIVNSQGLLDLLQDTTIHSGLVNTGTKAISTGVIGDVLGQPVHRYPALVSPAGENLKGFMAISDAIALCAGLPEEIAEGNPASIVVSADENTGLAVMTREVTQSNGVYLRTYTLVYGYNVGQAGALERILSASRS